MNPVVESVVFQLSRVAGSFNHTIEADDLVRVREDVANKLKQGWDAYEIFAYCKNQEEVNPVIEEDEALANMAAVRKRVELRLNQEDTP